MSPSFIKEKQRREYMYAKVGINLGPAVGSPLFLLRILREGGM
jgi:hypothetical protein